ncbi:MAG: hypothetical protein ACRCVW_05110 [Brevinema sp.]
MFFRKALTTDFLELKEKKWSTELKNSYIIEDSRGIIGYCNVDKNIIKEFFIDDIADKALFISMIEEFFFMAYDVLYTNDISFIDFGWTAHKDKAQKLKPSQNHYTLTSEYNKKS